MARRFVTRPRAATRRTTMWVALNPFEDNITGSGATLVSTANATLLALRPFTIVRTHLYWAFGSDQISANESQVVALGMAIVSEQAAAIGITAIPIPVTDLGSDLFFVHAWGSSMF